MQHISVYGVQTGGARRATRAFLNPGLVKIYTAFAVQQLTVQVSQCNAAQIILEYCAAFLRLLAALPSDQAPADRRVERSPMWPYSQANLLPAGTDIVTPCPQDAAAAFAHSQAAAADLTAGQAEPATEALSASQPSSDETPRTRAEALHIFDFLVTPPDGLIWAVLSNSSKPAGERRAALGLLTAVYQSNCSTVIEDTDHAAYCSKFHFTAFTHAYAEADVSLCCQHLNALQALAKHKVGLTPHMLLWYDWSIHVTSVPQPTSSKHQESNK